MAIRFDPFCKGRDEGFEFLSRCSFSDDRFEIAAKRSAKFKSQKVECFALCQHTPAKQQNPRLIRRYL